MNPPIGPADLRDIFCAGLAALAEKREELNALDRASGDGDHGSTIHRGAKAAATALRGRDFSTVNAVFETTGTAMLASMGGASGVLFGVWLRAARNCPLSTGFDPAVAKRFFESGLRELQTKTAAGPGDKTMMDALIPATAALADPGGRTLQEIFGTMAHAAAKGAENTIGLFPRYGRAAGLGERARDAKDPGAASVAWFFEALAAGIAGHFEA